MEKHLERLFDVDDVQTGESLNGLDARTKEIVKKEVNKSRVQNAIARSTKGQNNLVNQLKKMPAGIRDSVASGQAKFDYTVLYVRRELSGGSSGAVLPLFTSAIEESAGITNFYKQSIPENQGIALERIEFQYAAVATTNTDPESTTIRDTAKFIPLDSSAPAGVLNGELEIMVDGNSVTNRIPVSQFVNGMKNGSTGKANGFDLNAVKLLKPGAKIQFNLHLAAGIATSSRFFFEVSLKGDSLRA